MAALIMNKIASFTVNHDILEKGVYISRIDGDAVTYDIRMKKPNGGNYITPKALHTIEHLPATYVRNSESLYMRDQWSAERVFILLQEIKSPNRR